ncbi:DNA-3-methyladenine glycosylase [Paramagnetospirillum magnetotacticum MS-1]|uniref:DNA-3-methyladenine glycosylase n=1 Tax=Paramagnetospirillum magnetotacticum MS-1 TaxID=272627 RepID=A0A0C2YV61_PARME|nr:DNA-3-methyladenine glycosylase I [Paramagnetospirillum magnetotacticum]KIL99013.1 DNA-3-methyladenine glycosylase [Paramagnetospirillum magnetotacticum MS-1]
MSWYCDIAPGHPFHGPYHDQEYGFPLTDERALFERLCLEIFQAGLSWLIVLKKRPSMVAAFDGFDVDKVAAYGDSEMDRLLSDPGIIRNRRKLAAIVENARRLQALRAREGSFAAWIERHHPLSKEDWVRLFKSSFVFMGGEVVGEFLMSIGYLPGAHRADCPVCLKLVSINPPWIQVGEDFYSK